MAMLNNQWVAMLNYRRVTGNIRFTRGCPRSFQTPLGLVDENVTLATPKKNRYSDFPTVSGTLW